MLREIERIHLHNCYNISDYASMEYNISDITCKHDEEIQVVRCFYTSIFLWGCGNFFTLIGNSIVFCVCGFEFSVKFCATDGGYFFLGVVLYLFAGLRNRRSSGPPGVAVHPKPWSTEVIFEIGARLYIGVGGVTCFRKGF